MINNKNRVYEVVIVGSSCVGKTSICTRYFHKTFEKAPLPTIGIDPYPKTIKTTDDGIFMIRCLDIGGAERYQNVAKPYIEKAQVMICVFSFDNLKSFTSLSTLLKKVDVKYKILVGNKSDLVDDKKLVSSSQIFEFREKNDLIYFETSAQTGKNIKDLFGYIINVLADEFEQKNLLKLDDDLEPLMYNWNNNKNCWCW